MTTIEPSASAGRIVLPQQRLALRLSKEDAAALTAVARKLTEKGVTFVTISDVLRYALRVAAEGGQGPAGSRG